MSTAASGQGVSSACGMALGAKTQGQGYRVYTLLGDGEIARVNAGRRLCLPPTISWIICA